MSNVVNFSMLSVLLFLAFPENSVALPCKNSPARGQLVFLDWGREPVDVWEAIPFEMHRVTLPNKYVIGVTINEAPENVYQEAFDARGGFAVEMIEVSVFDLQGESPKLVGHNFAGSNSKQGYRDIGNPESDVAAKKKGIHLLLINPVCISESDYFNSH